MPWSQFVTIVGQVVLVVLLLGLMFGIIAEVKRSKQPTIEQREREARLTRYQRETERAVEERSDLRLGEER